MVDILCAWLRKGHNDCLLVYAFRVISLPFVCFRILETLRLRFSGVSRGSVQVLVIFSNERKYNEAFRDVYFLRIREKSLS